MESPLLATKLFVPQPRPGLVPRPRLMDQLELAFWTPLTLVSAPAGFGKTTAIAQWIASHKPPRPFAWVSLDERDNDPVRFWDYIIGGLKSFAPELGGPASALLHGGQRPSLDIVLTTLINELCHAEREIVLVIDDYHLIKAEAIHESMTFLLGHLPPSIHVVIATRVDPPLPLSLFRGRGTMTEIGANELRFNLEETGALLTEFRVSPLRPADLASIHEKTEGWVVGLKMAGLSMQGKKDVDEFINSFTGSQRYVMDYLMEEVLKDQTDEIRTFLLKTSVLEKLTQPLCHFLVGGSPKRNVIADLEHANLFLVALDDCRQWYRYHHLFAELLRHQFEVAFGPEEVRETHRQASIWHEERGLVDEAVHHALAARDWNRAMELIRRTAAERIQRGEISTLLSWLDSIPREVLDGDVPLYRYYCRALVTVDHPEAAAALKQLEQRTRGEDSLQGEVMALQAGVARQSGDGSAAIDLAERALSLLAPADLAMRARASLVLGLMKYDRGEYDDAVPLLNQAAAVGRQCGDYWIATGALQSVAGVMGIQGRLQQKADLLKVAIEVGGRSPAAAGPHCYISGVYYELNDLDSSALHETHSIELSRLSGNAETQV